MEQHQQVQTDDQTSSRHARVLEGLSRAGIESIKVIVREDQPGRWSAQGLEIDYAVGGRSFEEVTTEFARSLALMIDDHLRIYGHIQLIVRRAPAEVWSAFFDGVLKNTFEVKMDLLAVYSIPARLYVEKAA